MSEPESVGPSPKPPKVIKRYSNRKLYDTEESRYVTLDEVASMVKLGADLKIIDNRTKEDLTAVTLAQILVEEQRNQNQMPLSLLREIIRSPRESLTGWMSNLRAQAETRLDSAAELLKASQRAWEDWQKKVDERVKAALEGVLGNLPAMGRDFQSLMQRLEAMEHKLDLLEHGGAHALDVQAPAADTPVAAEPAAPAEVADVAPPPSAEGPSA
jgi:polyhydroxyalkanoate synthesis repressor PhaR